MHAHMREKTETFVGLKNMVSVEKYNGESVSIFVGFHTSKFCVIYF